MCAEGGRVGGDKSMPKTWAPTQRREVALARPMPDEVPITRMTRGERMIFALSTEGGKRRTRVRSSSLRSFTVWVCFADSVQIERVSWR